MFRDVVQGFLHDPKQRKPILLSYCAEKQVALEIYRDTVASGEVPTFGFNRSCYTKVTHHRRMESMRNTVDIARDAANFAKRFINSSSRFRLGQSEPQLLQVHGE